MVTTNLMSIKAYFNNEARCLRPFILLRTTLPANNPLKANKPITELGSGTGTLAVVR